MPNWVKTTLKFDGKEEDIKKIKELVITEDTEFDFRKIVPYPTREECPEKYRLNEELNIINDYGIHNEERHITVKPKLPYLDWYTWQCDKWGTKWNACEASWYGNEICFETAWSFCEPIVIELSKKFPDVTISFEYADEDIGGNCDYGWCNNGCIEFANLTGEAAMHHAIKIWGYEDEYEFRNGRWTCKPL